MNLFVLLEQAALRFPRQPAVCVGADVSLAYAELASRALRLGAGIRERCREGDRVAIVTENRPEYVELLFGIWAAGMVAVPINAKLHAREVAQIVDDAGAAAVFASPALAAGITDALRTAAAALRATVIGEHEYADCLRTPALQKPAPVAPDTLAWLFYTSGTTGRSKGAMLSHRNLLAMTIAYLADIDTVDEHASLLHAAPMSHGSGLYMLPYVTRAARHVIPASAGFEPREFLDLCNRHPACAAFLAPTMVQRLRIEAERSRTSPANLRTIVYGGGPMYVEELKKALAVFGPVFVQIYGQGEAPMTITSLRRADHACADESILGSVGWPRTGVDVAIVDANGAPLPIGEVGELVCRGDVVMAGYWNNATASSEALRDGWLYTGDLGSRDARGYVTLRDRSKDVVISGGSNIYPREVEEVLLAHPGVAEACVVGQPDAEWGEVVVAFVVAVPGTSVSADALDGHCLERIARFKRPKRYLFVDTLPKNSYGKVLKRELRARLPEQCGEGDPLPCPGNVRPVSRSKAQEPSGTGGSGCSRTEEATMAKYGKKAQSKVKKAMHERKAGTLRSGKSGKKVTSRKQAIAIGLSEARRAGGKVPKKSAKKSSRKTAKKSSGKTAKKSSRKTAKKSARKSSKKSATRSSKSTRKSTQRSRKSSD